MRMRVTHSHAAAAAAKSIQSCPTLCDPVDSSSSGSPVPGILQARTLEWVKVLARLFKLESGQYIDSFLICKPECPARD